MIPIKTGHSSLQMSLRPYNFLFISTFKGKYVYMKVIVLMAGIPKPLTLIAASVVLENSKIIEPCYIGENVILRNTTIGPNVSLGDDSIVENSHIADSLIQTKTTIKNANLKEAMVGNNAYFDGEFKSVSIGDYSVLK